MCNVTCINYLLDVSCEGDGIAYECAMLPVYLLDVVSCESDGPGVEEGEEGLCASAVDPRGETHTQLASGTFTQALL